ncbi:MAG TPA: haloacid dehalogenase type II [Hyphomonadaceae bacterium]|jgi:2-haloacid dehalogenase|nr:haloacid dehalogenase type II [Hyphomonadaceae bacterium]
MSDFSGVKALAFDVFGTTVDWCSGVAREAQAMIEPKGHTLDWTAFAVAWRKEYQPAMEAVRSGAREYVVMDTLHREMLESVLKEYGVGELSNAEKDELAFAWRKLYPWPDTIAGMLRLKKKFTLIALSNANVALAVEMAKRGGLPWDAVLGSQLVKQYKPRPEIYDSAASFLSLTNAQVMMVACHVWDLDGAKARGLRTAYVRRAAEFGGKLETKPPAAGTYDVTASDFGDLADQLGA